MDPSPENFDPAKDMVDSAYQPEKIIDGAYKDQEPPKLDGEDGESYRGEINNAEIIKESKLRAPKLREMLHEGDKVRELVKRLNDLSKLKNRKFLRSVVVFLKCIETLLEEGDNSTDAMYEITLRNLDILNDELVESSMDPIVI